MYAQQTAETQHRNTISQKSSTGTNRTGMPDNMKRKYEALSGLSMDDVRVHYNSGRPSQLGALAYTQGSHVYVAPGQERHLGHELGHVIQQKQGRVRATDSFDGVAVNLDDRLEREADAYDREARVYEAERAEKTSQEEYHNIPAIRTDVSGGVAQLRPVVDTKRNRPFYMDSKYRGKNGRLFLLKLFVEMGDYIVFQIRDHVRRIFWEKDRQWVAENPQNGVTAGIASETSEDISHRSGSIPDVADRQTGEDDYYTDRKWENKLDIDKFMEQQPLDAWLETYEETMGALTEIDANTALDSEEKQRRKDAITNYVLQRHIVNALYRAEELDRMDYSGSPLSYQNRSSYMRSGAGSFVDMLQQVLLNQGNPFPNKDLILTRSGEMWRELNKFFYYIPLSEEGDVEGAIQNNLSDELINSIAQFIIGLRTLKEEREDDVLQRELEDAEFPRIFVDATERPQDMDNINQTLRDTVFLRAAVKMNLFGDPADFIWVKNAETVPKGKKVQIVNERLKSHKEEQDAFFVKYIEGLQQQIPKQEEDHVETPQEKAVKVRLAQITQIQQTMEFSERDDRLATAYINYVKKVIPSNSFGKWDLLYRNMGSFATTGEMITLENEGIQQSALLLADTGMDSLAKAAVNKAGYVPSITEAVRMLMQYRGRQDLQKLQKRNAKYQPKPQCSQEEPPQESQQTLQWIAHNVWKQQFMSQWSRKDKLSTPEAWTDREFAMTKAEERILHPCSAQYKADDARGARDLAQTGFELFCQWLGHIERDPGKKGIAIQASVVKKLITQSQLFSNMRIPSFIWYQLDYYLEAAQYTEENIVDFSRNIQALHEIILLGIELAGEEAMPRGREFTLNMPPNLTENPDLYRGAYLADYGLKAFAQVYDAAAAQHAIDTGMQPLQIAAFYNIYFELTEKLTKTTEASSRRVSMTKPRDVDTFLGDVNAAIGKEELLQKLPDIIMIDIHPNDATKEYITYNNICALLKGLADLRDRGGAKKITMIIDITLNQAMDEEIQGIIESSEKYIADGWLNLVFVQSLTKFAQMGMDKHSGGLVFSYNKADAWKQFNDSLQASRQADPVDPYMQRYFQMLFDNAADEQREYIDIIRDNTRYVQGRLSTELAETAITLSVNDDEGSCYVAWHYEQSYSHICRLYRSCGLREPFPYTLHEFNIAILERGINVQMSKQRLPIAMRFSFGFPISNLGETGNEVRFTIGTETRAELNKYIEVIAKIGKSVQSLIQQTSDTLPEKKSKSCLFDLKQFEQYLTSLPSENSTT